MLHTATSFKVYSIVFTTSACALIIEIVAARLLAPFIGVSLYTWTSIIGIVLAGISAGNYLGGRVADRFPTWLTLSLILLASGASTLSILPLVSPATHMYFALPWVYRILLLTATLFFVPSLMLGMVTPVVIKLHLQDIAHTGKVVGKIYAVATLGAIFGTFITGFVLIPWIGARGILLVVSVVLAFLAVSVGIPFLLKRITITLILVFLGVASFGLATGSMRSDCLRESGYYCIQIEDRKVLGKVLRALRLDKLDHSYSYVEPNAPTFLVQPYEGVFAALATYIAQGNPEMQVLSIGGGGYVVPRFLAVRYPQSRLEVIEIDPAVTKVAQQYFGLRKHGSIVTYNLDARIKIPSLEPGKYDLVFGDAYNNLAIPYHLTTLEYNEAVRRLLTSKGIYAVNVIDKLHSGRFLPAMVYTLQQAFPYVYLLSHNNKWTDDIQHTYVVAASLHPLSAENVEEASVREDNPTITFEFMPAQDLQAWLHARKKLVLVDDYAPVENLVAPLAK